MNAPDEQWWARARQARDKLAAQVSGNPNVSLIDIGLDPDATSKTPVLRVHVRQGGLSELGLSNSIDGLPVRAGQGEYKLQ